MATDKISILAVDDEADIRAVLETGLARAGWRCADAPEGEAALEQVQGQRFSLVFLDLVMPGMNGAEAFREIRQIDPVANIEHPPLRRDFAPLASGPRLT